MRVSSRFVCVLLVCVLFVWNIDAFSCDIFEPQENEYVLPSYSFNKIPEVMEYSDGFDDFLFRTDTEVDALNIVSYKMNDGTESVFVFPENVKYRNEDGIVKDRSSFLEPQFDNSGLLIYRNDNDVISEFPDNYSRGVLLCDSNYKIKMSALNSSGVAKIRQKNELVYENAYSNIDVVYTVNFNGFKEEMIINNADFCNLFSFSFQTYGLTIINDNKDILLLDNDTIVGTLGKIIIFDAGNNYTETIPEIYTITEKEEYLVEFSIPEDFLIEPDIVYPIVVDPSITFLSGTLYGPNTKTAVVDSLNSIYMTEQSVLSIGYLGTNTWYNGLVSFPNILSFFDANTDRILSSSLILYMQSTYSAASSSCYVYAYPSTNTWYLPGYPSSGLFTSYAGSVYGRALLKTSYTPGKQINIPLTSIANEWINGNFINGNNVNGIHLVLSDSLASTSFYGSSTANTSYLPRLCFSLSSEENNSILSGAIYKLSGMISTNVLEYDSLQENLSPATDDLNNPNQLYKITYDSSFGGYFIYSIGAGKYLSFDSSTGEVLLTSSYSYNNYWFFGEYGGYSFIVNIYGKYLYLSSGFLSLTDSSLTLPYWNIRFFCLDIDSVKQETKYTCSSASIRMILSYYGISYLEADIESWQRSEYGSDWNDPDAVDNELTRLLQENHVNITYVVSDISSGRTITQYRNWLLSVLLAGCPMIIQLATDGQYLPSTGGHFLVLKGIYYCESNSTYYAIVNDPNYKPFNWGYTENEKAIPINILKYYQSLVSTPNGYYWGV